MITLEFIVIALLAFSFGGLTIYILFRIIPGLIDDCSWDIKFLIFFAVGLMVCVTVILTGLSITLYKGASPQAQKQYLLDRIERDKREYEKFIIDHPELKEE